MTAQKSFQQGLLDSIAELLEPLALAATNPVQRAQLLGALGWDLAALAGQDEAVFEAWLNDVGVAVGGIRHLVETGGPHSLEDLLAALPAVRAAVQAAVGLPPALGGQLPADLPVETLGEDLLTYLVATLLRRRLPVVLHLAVLLGLLVPAEDTEVSLPAPATGPPVRLPARRPELHLERVADLLTDPVGTLRALYFPAGWWTSDDADRAAALLLPRLADLLVTLGARATYGVKPDEAPDLGPYGRALAGHMLTVSTDLPVDGARVTVGASLGLSAMDRGGLGVVVVPRGGLQFSTVAGGWGWKVDLSGAGAAFAVGAQGVVISGGAAAFRGALEAARLPGEAGYALLIGSTTGTRLQVGTLRLAAEASFGAGHDDIGFTVSADSAQFVLSAGDGDGFLQRVLPNELRAPFDLAIGWSRTRGLYLRGAGGGGDAGEPGLAGTLPVALNLGVLKIPSVYVAVRPKDGGTIELAAAASADVQLGPVAANVERTGLAAEISFPPGGGNLGPLDVALRFAPPAGVGLGIQSGLVTGSGYLFADPAGGQYAGAVQLQIGKVGVAAVGLLTTRMPGGAPGFSLLILFSVRFPAVPLGLGFALTGIGGLVGVHRTIAVDQLRKGLESGSLDTVLFPPDLVHNARQVVADLGRYFPPVADQYVIGPTAELVWGTPPVVTITLGLFLEFPSPLRLVLAGRLAATLPTQQSPVVVLRMDLLGSLDLTAKTLAVDAVLVHSRVAAFALTGQAAVRAGWGDSPGFVLAAGGFHPRFKPPADFPELARLALTLGGGDNPRLRLSAYFALTPNTVQVGARLDLYAAADLGPAGVFALAAVAGFDALFQLSPFAFTVDISVAVLLTWNQQPFLAVRLDLTLSGPQPWHAVGQATFECFGTHRVAFELTIGEPPAPAPVPSVDVAGGIAAALGAAANWTAELPAEGTGLLSLRQRATGGDGVAVHPFGTLTARQQVAPLGVDLARVGTARIAGPRRVTVDAVRLGTQTLGWQGGPPPPLAATTDYFAPAQFLDLTDAEKLAAPSFEQMTSGVRVRRPKPVTSAGVTAEVGLATVVVDPGPRQARFTEPAVTVTADAVTVQRLLAQLGGGAATQVGPAVQAARFAGVPQVTVGEPEYALAHDNLTVPPGNVAHLPTYTVAEQRRQAAAVAASLRVVGASEIPSGVQP